MNFSLTFNYAIDPSGVIALAIFGIVGVIAYALHKRATIAAQSSKREQD